MATVINVTQQQEYTNKENNQTPQLNHSTLKGAY